MSDIKNTDNKNTNNKTGSIKLDILLVTSTMQHQNGLRVNDYNRYSHFCRKKINKLRKLFKLTQGKGKKFQRVEITPEKVTDNKILLIAILECERNWSYGMYHKQELTAIGEDIKRLRYEITRKFKRASKNAKDVVNICDKVADIQTQLEAQAYFNVIHSNYLIFTRKFKEALELLKTAKNIYEKIALLKDTIETLEYKEKINNIITSMRLCIYNLSTEKDMIFDENEFEKNVDVEDIEITEKIEEIKKKNSEINVIKEGEYIIHYQNMSIPIKNEKLKELFINQENLSKKIEKEENILKKIPLFQDYYNRIDEMIKIVKNEKNENAQGTGTDNFTKIYSNILNYIENLRIKKYIDKNISYIKDYQKEFNDIETINNLFEKENLKLRVKPQEIMKLYDNLIEYQKQLISNEKDNPDHSYLIDLNYREKIYQLSKIFFAGLFYVLNKKFLESYTIGFYIIDKIKESNEFYEQQNLKDISNLKELKEITDNYKKLCLFIINTSFAKMNQSKEDKNEKKEKKIKFNPFLSDEILKKDKITLNKEQYETMNKYINLPYEDYMNVINNNSFNNYNNIMQIPMNTSLIEPKPIIFDLIYDKFDYPDLTNKTKEGSKGIMGKLFGFLSGS